MTKAWGGISLGVQRDVSEAAMLYRCSADNGFAHAQFSFGLCLRSGWGAPKDITDTDTRNSHSTYSVF